MTKEEFDSLKPGDKCRIQKPYPMGGYSADNYKLNHEFVVEHTDETNGYIYPTSETTAMRGTWHYYYCELVTKKSTNLTEYEIC